MKLIIILSTYLITLFSCEDNELNTAKRPLIVVAKSKGWLNNTMVVHTGDNRYITFESNDPAGRAMMDTYNVHDTIK